MHDEPSQGPQTPVQVEAVRPQGESQPRCVIVGIGASAGGLAAFETFFTQMPPDSGMAFVLVQHLAPDRESLLPALLARHTRMPVLQVTAETLVAPDHVYVIPPDATLTITSGVLNVESPPGEPRGHRTPIDHFFRSLAVDQGAYAVCIMLSGTGTDGTLGLQAVKEYGGMAVAQTPASARYDSILRSAIATGLVDHILPAEAMPAKLIEYAAHLAARRTLRGPESLREAGSEHLSTIYRLLRRQTGHDFSQYKETTIHRRLHRRLRALQLDAVAPYVERLRQDPQELEFLFKDLLIGVTHFFRDPEAFAALARTVIPRLFADKGADDRVRVCVSGCATGEEAYSLAILLREHMATLDVVPQVQVFATDIDAQALETARRGIYPVGIADHVTPERLEHFFVKQDHTYQVQKALREMCLFTAHSLIKDPPFSRLDLISCRNVLIYLGPELQQKLMRLFHYALRPGGYLFLGPAETLSGQRELFRPLDQQHRIFQKTGQVVRALVEFPLTDVPWPAPPPGAERERRHPTAAQQLGPRIERTILDHYAPACVICTEQGEAVYFCGRTGRYFEPPAGILNANLLHMARPGLRLPLRTTLHQAVTTRQRVVQERVEVQTNGDVQTLTLVVEPRPELGDDVPLYMVLFQDVGSAESRAPDAATPVTPGAEDAHLRALEHELRATQERLSTTIEELVTTNEELSSANEEFQSTNEELETSKEELQSLNEELETVNAELHRKVDELDRINSDLRNLLDSTQIATIFLDAELCIKNFTPAISAVVPLRPGDLGRPLADLAQRFVDVDLVGEARDVLRTLGWQERSLRTTDGDRRYLLRLGPYRTVANVIDGGVLTFTDVTALQQAEEAAHAAQVYAESIVATVRTPLLGLDADLRVRSANRAFYDLFHVTPVETEGRLLFAVGLGAWDIPALRRQLIEVLAQHQAFEDFEVDYDSPTSGPKTLLLNAREIPSVAPDTTLLLLAIEDITVRKQAEQTLAQGRTQLEQRVQERTALLALLQDITRAANEATASAEALQYAVDRLCTSTGWPVGHVYLAVTPGEPRWAPTSIWHLGVPERFTAFQQTTQTSAYAAGEDLIGRVGADAQLAWNVDVATALAGPRQHAALEAGLTAGVAIPILVGSEVAGVVECYACAPLAPDPALQDALTQMGIQLGRAVEGERAAAQAQRHQEALVQREKLAAMGSLLAGVAHELNNPLAVIMLQAELLRAAAGGGPLAAYAEDITQAAARCERLVRQFLALARPHVPERTAVDLNALITDTMELLAPSLQVDNIAVDLRLAVDLPPLAADPHQLQQVLVNLVTNAHQALRAAPPPRQVTLTTRCDPARTRITLEVADTGPGIPLEMQARIFEPFFTTKPPGVGTGLGLSLCQGIIAGHGGTIRVTSQPAQGTTFQMELPVGVVPEPAPSLPARDDAPPLVPSSAILLVDDEPSMASALARLLRRDGHTVETAANGRLALTMLQEHAYDLILCDMRMPELDGPGLYRALAAQYPHLCRRFVGPYRGYPEPRGSGLCSRERCPPVDQTLHRGGSPRRHSAGPVSRLSALLQSELPHPTPSARGGARRRVLFQS
jgi:two-component system CheB/CheR fusion protein